MAEMITHRGLTRCAAVVVTALLAGCPTPPDPGGGAPVYNNTTDPTNGNARYVGMSACASCHPSLAQTASAHGHTQALKRIEGHAPTYAEAGTRAGVPDPPAGFTWQQISYVISGYIHGAFFVDTDGFILTDGTAGVNTQWNLDFPPIDATARFVEYRPEQNEPLPFDHDTCFRCHTTGPQPQDPQDPRSQENRPGIRGTWVEAGVMCEACHGPGSNHVGNPAARDLYVDPRSETCARCHTAGDDVSVILAADGYVNPNSQTAELLASGGHADFECGYCHDSHASIVYDRANGLRNACSACHPNANLAFHDGATYIRADHTEPVTCESCHMPYTGRSNAVAAPAYFATVPGRAGDVRGHIFRIDTQSADFNAMFTPGGDAVQKDTQGRAAVTVDFVCLRCHHETGNAFPLTLEGARRIADGMHTRVATPQ
jgi:hypothetical protein